jgi:hypothetical protein
MYCTYYTIQILRWCDRLRCMGQLPSLASPAHIACSHGFIGSYKECWTRHYISGLNIEVIFHQYCTGNIWLVINCHWQVIIIRRSHKKGEKVGTLILQHSVLWIWHSNPAHKQLFGGHIKVGTCVILSTKI